MAASFLLRSAAVMAICGLTEKAVQVFSFASSIKEPNHENRFACP